MAATVAAHTNIIATHDKLSVGQVACDGCGATDKALTPSRHLAPLEFCGVECRDRYIGRTHRYRPCPERDTHCLVPVGSMVAAAFRRWPELVADEHASLDACRRGDGQNYSLPRALVQAVGITLDEYRRLTKAQQAALPEADRGAVRLMEANEARNLRAQRREEQRAAELEHSSSKRARAAAAADVAPPPPPPEPEDRLATEQWLQDLPGDLLREIVLRLPPRDLALHADTHNRLAHIIHHFGRVPVWASIAFGPRSPLGTPEVTPTFTMDTYFEMHHTDYDEFDPHRDHAAPPPRKNVSGLLYEFALGTQKASHATHLITAVLEAYLRFYTKHATQGVPHLHAAMRLIVDIALYAPNGGFMEFALTRRQGLYTPIQIDLVRSPQTGALVVYGAVEDAMRRSMSDKWRVPLEIFSLVKALLDWRSATADVLRALPEPSEAIVRTLMLKFDLPPDWVLITFGRWLLRTYSESAWAGGIATALRSALSIVSQRTLSVAQCLTLLHVTDDQRYFPLDLLSPATLPVTASELLYPYHTDPDRPDRYPGEPYLARILTEWRGPQGQVFPANQFLQVTVDELFRAANFATRENALQPYTVRAAQYIIEWQRGDSQYSDLLSIRYDRLSGWLNDAQFSTTRDAFYVLFSARRPATAPPFYLLDRILSQVDIRYAATRASFWVNTAALLANAWTTHGATLDPNLWLISETTAWTLCCVGDGNGGDPAAVAGVCAAVCGKMLRVLGTGGAAAGGPLTLHRWITSMSTSDILFRTSEQVTMRPTLPGFKVISPAIERIFAEESKLHYLLYLQAYMSMTMIDGFFAIPRNTMAMCITLLSQIRRHNLIDAFVAFWNTKYDPAAASFSVPARISIDTLGADDIRTNNDEHNRALYLALVRFMFETALAVNPLAAEPPGRDQSPIVAAALDRPVGASRP